MPTELKNKCKLDEKGFCPVCKRQIQDFNPNIFTVRDCLLYDIDSMALIHTKDGNPAYFKNLFYNQSTFLVCAGPSLKSIDLTFLSRRGIHSTAVNNVAASFVRPNLWVCVDQVENFHEVIWKDPTILKLFPEHCAGKPHRVGVNRTYADYACRLNPNCFFYPLDSLFNVSDFLSKDCVSFGREKGTKDDIGISGGRSVMLAAFKLLYYLGFRQVFLLGCDFKMTPEEQYAFDEYKEAEQQATNNEGYEILIKRLRVLQPHFLNANFHVFNCNDKSNLTVFPFISVELAIQKALEKFPQYEINLKGMYH